MRRLQVRSGLHDARTAIDDNRRPGVTWDSVRLLVLVKPSVVLPLLQEVIIGVGDAGHPLVALRLVAGPLLAGLAPRLEVIVR